PASAGEDDVSMSASGDGNGAATAGALGGDDGAGEGGRGASGSGPPPPQEPPSRTSKTRESAERAVMGLVWRRGWGNLPPLVMKTPEYQAKQLFARYGIPIPKGEPAFKLEEVAPIAERLKAATNNPVVVVKAQIHAGGRGKGG